MAPWNHLVKEVCPALRRKCARHFATFTAGDRQGEKHLARDGITGLTS
jgi:hypothetical protein